jgi:hypothetical protein
VDVRDPLQPIPRYKPQIEERALDADTAERIRPVANDNAHAASDIERLRRLSPKFVDWYEKARI